MTPAIIGVDWGTSNLRGWALDEQGAVLASAALPCGVSTVTDGDFASVLRRLTGAWTTRQAPIVLGGMIGSRQGWREVPYIACPASPEALAAGAQPVDTGIGPGWIVPGLSCVDGNGVADVMRGEEVQLLGAGIESGVALLPGTHGKWVRIEDGAVTRFRTFMTGELFALLRQHSLLGRLMEPGEPDDLAFDAGVGRALEDHALTALLFSVRTEGLFGRIAPTGLADYLSGLLIGAEIAGVRGEGDVAAIIAEAGLARRYARAMDLAGMSGPQMISGEVAAVAGLARIGQAILEGLA